MKVSRHVQGSRYGHSAARRGERGFLVIALLAIVAIMLIYVNVNVRRLGNLKRELKLVEQQQIQRLERIGAQPSPLSKAPTNETTTFLAPELGAPAAHPAR